MLALLKKFQNLIIWFMIFKCAFAGIEILFFSYSDQ